MAFNKKEQSQTAGDNSTQTQIEHVDNYNDVTINQFIIQSRDERTSGLTIEGPTTPLIDEENTSLWERTLGQDNENVKPLRESYLQARENAKILLDKIGQDFPNLTAHDITHVVTLWNIADTIIGEKYTINPLEAYVLGIALLIHDTALSYDAVGGKDKLRNTLQWKDAFAEKPENVDEEEFKKECDLAVIIANHAQEAEKILSKLFTKDDGSTFYIVNEETYRKHLGDLIGKIAASHRWSIDEVELKLKNQVNPIAGMPKEWIINARKLACILRCADAGHIDNGRAPDDININENSHLHWAFQNHLCQVSEDEKDDTKLCITSSYPFKKEEFAAWHMAYEAVRLFDEELKRSNNLLKAIGCEIFPHNGVSGAGSKEELAEYVETDGWQPCDFGVHTSNIKLLIENLGGSKLYGEEHKLLVVLRELIQNARDAIHARQKMDNSYRDGRITIRSLEDGKNRFIEIEDNGIGMSMDCIKNNLLDFGSSYWKSSLLKYENPGLRSAGFKSVGKYGIGFYSVFMVAKSVEVRTKRYDKGNNEAKRVEFPAGLTLSPIISNDTKSAGTIVKIELTNDDDNWYFGTGEFFFQHLLDLKKALPIIVAGLDVDVYYEEDSHSSFIHTSIDSSTFDRKVWLRNLLLDEYDIIDDEIDEIADSLEFIIDCNGEKRGLISVPNENLLTLNFPSIETINGLFLSLKQAYTLNMHLGYLSFKNCNINRNEVICDPALSMSLRTWIKKIYIKNHDEIYNSFNLSEYYAKLMKYCRVTKEDRQELIELNRRNLYRTYRNRSLEIGTFNGLKDIQSFLFSGIISDSDMPASLRRFAQSRLYYSHDSLKTQVNKYDITDFEQIFSKFIEVYHGFQLDKGDKYSAVEVWFNLMLNESLGKMIEWDRINQNPDEYHLFLANVKDHKGRIILRKYLEQYLINSDFTGKEELSKGYDISVSN